MKNQQVKQRVPFAGTIGTMLPLLLLTLAFSACSAQDRQEEDGARENNTRTVSRLDRANDDITGSRRNAITRAVESASPAVVGINVTEVREVQFQDPFASFFDDPFFRQHFGDRFAPRTYRQEVKGLGSGFLISDDGYIITNDHVAGRASKVIVTMTDGKHYDAKIIGSDPVSDVALLKIEGKNLPHLKLGNSDDIIIGEWVIALGNPFGLFDINSKPTITVGVVSNTGVDLSPQDNRVYREMIQTDAAISSGNSGGPLVNALGEVIAMNTIIYSTSQSQMGAGSIGIGFAVPVNRVKEIVDELRRNGSIARDFWTGMRIQQIDANIRRYLRLKSDEGVVIVDMAPDSPASKAGLEIGDVIININGNVIRTEDDALTNLIDARVGDVLKLRVIRDGAEQTKSMTLTKRPAR